MQKEQPKKRLGPKVKYTLVGLVLLLVTASLVVAYTGQQKQIADLTRSANESKQKAKENAEALSEEIKKNSVANANLQKKYQEALSKLQSQESGSSGLSTVPSAQDLDITVGKAIVAAIDPATPGLNALAVNLTLKNNTKSTITVGPASFVVKDTKNATFDAPFVSWGGFGKDFVPLVVTELSPGQSLTGYVGVLVVDLDTTDYRLIAGDRSFDVRATKSPSWPIAD